MINPRLVLLLPLVLRLSPLCPSVHQCNGPELRDLRKHQNTGDKNNLYVQKRLQHAIGSQTNFYATIPYFWDLPKALGIFRGSRPCGAHRVVLRAGRFGIAIAVGSVEVGLGAENPHEGQS